MSIILSCLTCLVQAAPGSAADDPELDHECTSWMVFSNLTKNNTNILHKNRDAHPRSVAPYISPAGAARKWIAQGNEGATCMGLNASGVAGIMNSGEKCINPSTDPRKPGTTKILRMILESCDTAAQAAAAMQKFIKERNYWHKASGSTFFFLDKNEGFICEMTGKDCIVQRYTAGYAVRANIWQNPDMQKFSRSSIKYYLNSSARAFIAISKLNAAVDKYGKITLDAIFDLSRHWEMPEESPQKRSVCFNKTNSTGSLEIDRQFPEVLSSAYFTIGHPRHTVYVPIPVCAEKLHPAMENMKWSAAAWKRFDKLGLGAPFPEEWLKFEKDALKKYGNAKEQARKLLIQGKKKEAVKLLNDTAREIWNKAAALMKL